MTDRKQAYREALKHPLWAKKRLRIFRRDKFQCTMCESKKSIQVHHMHYIRGNAPWNHPDCFLFTLCRTCHQKNHDLYGISVLDKSEVSWVRKPRPSKKEKKGHKKKIKTLPPDEALLKEATRDAKKWIKRVNKKNKSP